jgi:hypothetical protein
MLGQGTKVQDKIGEKSVAQGGCKYGFKYQENCACHIYSMLGFDACFYDIWFLCFL